MRHEQAVRSFFLPLSQPNPWATAVLVDELYTGRLQRLPQGRHGREVGSQARAQIIMGMTRHVPVRLSVRARQSVDMVRRRKASSRRNPTGMMKRRSKFH